MPTARHDARPTIAAPARRRRARREGGVHFRVWAPRRKARRSRPRRRRRPVALTPEDDGYFSGTRADAPAPARSTASGSTATKTLYPDPASRFQPQGPHGPSQVVDPAAFHWTDDGWTGIGAAGQVLYEMHVGTFTPEGTWEAAAARAAGAWRTWASPAWR